MAFISNDTDSSTAGVGRSSAFTTCLPLHSGTGLSTAGCGSVTCSHASDSVAAAWQNSSRVSSVSLRVSRKAAVRKSCVAAMSGSPERDVMRFSRTSMSSAASARDSSVCGRCRFISSPSKSALYGVQQHSLKRKVRPGSTRARWHMMDILCSDGWRLKSTGSPSARCRSTMSPMRSSRAALARSPNCSVLLPPAPAADAAQRM